MAAKHRVNRTRYYCDIIERVVGVRENKRGSMPKGLKRLNIELLVALSNEFMLLWSCFYRKLVINIS